METGGLRTHMKRLVKALQFLRLALVVSVGFD
jgi:hypothetical protein